MASRFFCVAIAAQSMRRSVLAARRALAMGLGIDGDVLRLFAVQSQRGQLARPRRSRYRWHGCRGRRSGPVPTSGRRRCGFRADACREPRTTDTCPASACPGCPCPRSRCGPGRRNSACGSSVLIDARRRSTPCSRLDQAAGRLPNRFFSRRGWRGLESSRSISCAERCAWRSVQLGASPACTMVQPSASSWCSSRCERSHSNSTGASLGKQHLAQFGIDPRLRIRLAQRDRQQAEVVIAQRDHARLAQLVDQSQRRQRLAATIDQVAAEPQPILRRVEAQLFEQSLQFGVAALHVADSVGSHQCSVRGIDRVKVGIGASNSVPSSASIW